MVIMEATKKKLMKLGFSELWANQISNNALFTDILLMTEEEIYNRIRRQPLYYKSLEPIGAQQPYWRDQYSNLVIHSLNQEKLRSCSAWQSEFDGWGDDLTLFNKLNRLFGKYLFIHPYSKYAHISHKTHYDMWYRFTSRRGGLGLGKIPCPCENLFGVPIKSINHPHGEF